MRKLAKPVRKEAKRIGKLAKPVLMPSKTEKIFPGRSWMRAKSLLRLT